MGLSSEMVFRYNQGLALKERRHSVKIGVEIILDLLDNVDPETVTRQIWGILIRKLTNAEVVDVNAFDMEAEAAKFLRASLKSKGSNADESFGKKKP